MKMDYVTAIGLFYPTVIVVCKGNPHDYSDIEWIGGDQLPSVLEVDEMIFEDVKKDKILELSAACENDIVNGFTSDALGYPCIYDAEQVDQLNITGVLTMISPTPDAPMGYLSPYAVRPIIDGVVQPKVYLVHTYPQLRKALTDGGMYKLLKLQQFNTKRDLVNTATSVEAVEAITWNS